MPRFLFICGVARSGTSALVHLLNAHPAVCVGMERFRKVVTSRPRRFTPTLFTPERFFSFEPTDTTILPSVGERWADFYADLEAKFAQATHVGDKIPHLFCYYDAVSRQFPNATFVYIARGIEDVAQSWNARAENPTGTWRSSSDYRAAVQWWNRGIHATLAFLAKGGNVCIVEYDRLFFGDETYFTALCERLGLSIEPIVEFYRHSTAEWTKRPRPERIARDGQDAYLRGAADTAAYNVLLGHALLSNTTYELDAVNLRQHLRLLTVRKQALHDELSALAHTRKYLLAHRR